ncbi:MAG: hypothetical protein RL088_2597 [Verrucomicrobiota bacterium]|jgi:hypothetical protein
MRIMKKAAILTTLLFSLAAPLVHAQDPQKQRVDAALKKATDFLISQQQESGAIAEKGIRPDVTMTSLAILAMGALGHQPADPTPEGRAMKKGLEFVLKPGNQEPDGYFGKSDGSRMYGHGIISLMLAEMLGMGADEKQDAAIRERCRKAIELILRSQRMPKNEHNRGGWRYTPDAADSDMSVTCWQVMALRAARNAGMDVPKESIDLAVRYIKSLYSSGERRGGPGGFGYASKGTELSTTAEGLLALQVCGEYEAEETKGASERLLQKGLRSGDKWFYYTAYYMAQGMYQRGEKYATEGRRMIYDAVLPLQRGDGSWEGEGGEERQGGKVYATSLAMLSLAVKNHFLPIYQR